MCDIFPVFQNFCLCVNLKIGMLIIAMLAIITGSIVMSIAEQRAHTTYKDLINVTQIRDTKDALSHLGQITRSGISIIALIFMFTGIVLLIATLTDQEGFVQVFVWVTFANILFGFILVAGITLECFNLDTCLLDEMDWLSASTLMVFITGYLIVWIYLISVANSYVVQVFQ